LFSDKKNKYQALLINPVRVSTSGTRGGVMIGVAGLSIGRTDHQFSAHDGNLHRVGG